MTVHKIHSRIMTDPAAEAQKFGQVAAFCGDALPIADFCRFTNSDVSLLELQGIGAHSTRTQPHAAPMNPA